MTWQGRKREDAPVFCSTWGFCYRRVRQASDCLPAFAALAGFCFGPQGLGSKLHSVRLRNAATSCARYG